MPSSGGEGSTGETKPNTLALRVLDQGKELMQDLLVEQVLVATLLADVELEGSSTVLADGCCKPPGSIENFDKEWTIYGGGLMSLLTIVGRLGSRGSCSRSMPVPHNWAVVFEHNVRRRAMLLALRAQ